MIAVQIDLLVVMGPYMSDTGLLASSSYQQTANAIRVGHGLCYGGSVPLSLIYYELTLTGVFAPELLLLCFIVLVRCLVSGTSLGRAFSDELK